MPVNTKVPLAFVSVSVVDRSLWTSPPNRSWWRPVGRVHEYVALRRRSERSLGVRSRRPVMLENESVGTPHPDASGVAPMMPALPATSRLPANLLIARFEDRLVFTFS